MEDFDKRYCHKTYEDDGFTCCYEDYDSFNCLDYNMDCSECPYYHCAEED